MEKNKTEVVMQPQQNQVTNVSCFTSTDLFKEGWNIAGAIAESDLIPNQFRGKKANVLIAMNMAQRMQADPLMVMQSLVVVHGTPTFEAKFAIACFNATGKYSPIRYREVGEKGKDTWGYVAYAIEKSTGEVCEGPEVTISTAKAEGWYNQNAKWKNIPDLMLRYRAASWFIRTTDPGVMMGFQTKEEVEDYADYEEVPTENAPQIQPKDANSETLDMNGQDADAGAAANGQGQGPGEGKNNAPEPAKPEPTAPATDPQPQAGEQKTSEAKPLGKQQVPDIFGEKN